MRLDELQQAGRAPALPLSLELDGEPLVMERLLRVLPGQRYVGLARWRGRAVLAKLLVGGKAERHFQRELAGARLLAEQGLTTPTLLADGFAAGQGGWLLFDYLEGAESLWDAWRAVAREPLLSAAQQAVLGEALDAIGRLHARGLWQADLHLDNLLRHDGSLHVIDGGGVQVETAGHCRARGCWKTSGCSSPNCRPNWSPSPKSCWCTTCWPTPSTPCRWRRCSRKWRRCAAGAWATT